MWINGGITQNGAYPHVYSVCIGSRVSREVIPLISYFQREKASPEDIKRFSRLSAGLICSFE